MIYNKTWITWFNKNKNKELYNEIINKEIPEHKRCRICNGPIYYYDSIFRINKDKKLYVDKKSYLTKKIIENKEYYLSVCEECLTKKYPEYQTLNKGRVFNRICDITNFAFNIPEKITEEWKKKNYSITLENFIKKYGEEKGKLKWENYLLKQSKSNTLEYKKEKYGWDKNKFDEYNKSRSVTLKNCVLRHGEEDGLKIWENYIEKQKLTKSKEYYVDKYGLDEWLKLCKSKKISLTNFKEKYGELEGEQKYIQKVSRCYPPSKVSQDLFEGIDVFLEKKYRTYYYNKDGIEFGKLLSNGRYVFLDFYIKELKLNIEYNGDIWHANPKIYKKDDKPIPFNDKTSEDIWKSDKEKINLLERDFGIKTIVIWESDKKPISELLNIIKKHE